MLIKTFYKRIKEMYDLAPSLPCLKDQPDCPPEVVRRNVSMTPFAMCSLLMRNVSVQVEDENNCMYDIAPTNPKKLVEQLTKIETNCHTDTLFAGICSLPAAQTFLYPAHIINQKIIRLIK